MATMSSPDSDDPLGIGRKLGFHRSSNYTNSHSYFQQQSRCPPHIVVSDTAGTANGAISGGGVVSTLRSSANGKSHHSGYHHHHHHYQQQQQQSHHHHQHNHHHNHHHHHHHHHSSISSNGTNNDLLMAKVKMKAAVDPLAHKHVEENIETFLETFKHKTWSVDAAASVPGREGGMSLLDTRRTSCSDSGDYDDADDNSSTTTNTTDSHCWTSSVISTADDISTDSPGDGPAFLGGGSSGLSASGATGGGAVGGVGAGSRKHPSTLEYSTSGSARGVSWRDSDSIIAESRRIARWAWRQSNFTGTQDTPCSCSYHPPRKSIQPGLRFKENFTTIIKKIFSQHNSAASTQPFDL
ncbi:hypothetical protein ElyMa_002698800 [Elysia marginata]|uniref:Uncharacterized protein n=1 Tax=Elysia marginata TaxID=1093978 RepID=A0AAV4HEY9_9GAST|nr:hypothetical protein ElyMa_002698800 [Elysia marginata]